MFYLTSRTSSKSIKPVKYHVWCNNNKIDRKDFSRFTYEQCYRYYNYQGAVSVPGVLRCVYQLKNLAGGFKEQLMIDDRMGMYPYFM